MATNEVRAMEVFWSEDGDGDSSKSMDLVFVKGRPGCSSLKQVQNTLKMPKENNYFKKNYKQPVDTAGNPKTENSTKVNPNKETVQDSSNGKLTKNVRLKDLHPEDKKRVAGLVKELAKVGEEKEIVVNQFYEQRNEYDEYVKNLLDQQQTIITERENVMKQLYDCQKMLSKYQKMLTELQQRSEKKASQKSENKGKKRLESPSIKANKSITDMYHTKSAVHQNDPKEEKKLSTLGSNLAELSTPKRKPYVPSVANSSEARPFTTMIDQLIDKEKNSPIHSGTRLSTNGNKQYKKEESGHPVTDSEIPKDSLYGIGPLSAPLLSSTQQSELVSNATNSPLFVQSESRTKAHEFAPLPLEESGSNTQCSMLKTEQSVDSKNSVQSTSCKSDSQSQQSSTKSEKLLRFQAEKNALLAEQQWLRDIISQQQQIVAEYQQLKSQVSPVRIDRVTDAAADQAFTLTPHYEPLRQNALSKVQFSSPVHYEFHTPEKKHILVDNVDLINASPSQKTAALLKHKQALLLEQERLRLILESQENLLKSKQDQLHQQQQLQQHRLNYFKETGRFPMSDVSNTVTPTTTKDSAYAKRNHDKRDRSSALALNVLNVNDNNGQRFDELPNRSTTASTEDGSLNDSMQNLMFLIEDFQADKQIPTKKQNLKNFTKCTKKLLDRNAFMQQDTYDLSNRQMSKSISNTLRREPFQALADIVDEVERITVNKHNSYQSPQSQSARYKHASPNGYTTIENQSPSIDSIHSQQAENLLEESQLLEDVFFVK